jgi:Ca2+-binding RTX toxin-like protein
MANTNTNDSNVVGNNNGLNSGTVLDTGFDKPGIASGSSYRGTSVDGVQTVLGNLNQRNAGGMDDPATENGDYEVATAIATGNFLDNTPLAGLSTTVPGSNFAALLNSNVPFVQFLPTEQVAKPEWAAAGTPGSYLTGASWSAAPKAVTLTPNASAFTLTNTNDGGKTVVLSESITGAPFTTGNGAVSEALIFRGANDTLAVKHNVAVANVPATTNNSTGAALDVRNENYAETYAKPSVSSNYAWNSAHKYAEVNGNQSLNDAFAQTYAYRDDKLTINSAVKTAVADAAYFNGAERIVENCAVNYSYEHKDTGSVKYVVTDTRNLAQVDQRTWTNITVTNVAKFDVDDKVNGTKISAKGLITGTTTNISSAKPVSDINPTEFKATPNTEFKVDSAHYSLVVDPKEFNKDHNDIIDGGDDALSALVNAAKGSDICNSALGNVPAGSVSMADAFNPYVTVLTKDAAGVATSDRIIGTQFNDSITVNDKLAFGGSVNAGAGNDTITGGKGADTITVGTAAKEVDVIIGFEAQDKLVDAAGKAFQAKTVTQLADGNIEVVAANGYKVVLQKPSATLGDVQKYANPFDFSSATTAQTIGGVVPKDNDGADTMIGGSSTDTITGGKGADKLTGGAGADKFIFTDLTNGAANRVDTITDFSKTAGDKIDVSALGFKTFVDGAFTAANSANALRFDAATQTLQGNTGDLTKIELEIKVIGDAPTATDFIFA